MKIYINDTIVKDSIYDFYIFFVDETELRYFFGANTALSLFDSCLFFLEGVKKTLKK